MLPPRVILNAVYAMLTTGMTGDERDEFDAQLYGWNDLNKQAEKKLFDVRGGED